jgi:hypothetical protein
LRRREQPPLARREVGKAKAKVVSYRHYVNCTG